MPIEIRKRRQERPQYLVLRKRPIEDKNHSQNNL
jgi:hypothetical protein